MPKGSSEGGFACNPQVLKALEKDKINQEK
jgi:hypothetical protein